MCVAMAFPLIAGEAWYFLPNYGQDVRGVETPHRGEGRFFESLPEPARHLLQPDGGLSFDRREKVAWRKAWFPHSGFARMMPDNNVFGWYGCEFSIPAILAGLDLWLDLGIVDDADETFVNGAMVGRTGAVPGGSAWQEDRLYRVPFTRLNLYGDNFMAVHVWSLWGLGGIVGPPVLKAAVAPPDAQWNVAFVHDADAPAGGLNDSRTVTGAFETFLTGKELEWQEATMPWKGYADWAEDAHYAVFRLSFDLHLEDGMPRAFKSPVVMDCGPVFDVAAFYLNGKRVGLVGRFPENDLPAFTEAAQRARFIVEPDDWAADGHNELTIVVFRERGVGGLPGVPGILLDNPMTLGGDPSPADYFEAFKILVQSDRLVDASEFLVRASRESMSGLGHAWLLSHKAHAAYLGWLDGGREDGRLLNNVVASIAELLAKYSVESPKQSAMQAFCQILRMAEKDGHILTLVKRFFPEFGKNCVFQGQDTETRGDWMLHYGSDGWILPAMGQVTDWKSSNVQYCSFGKKVNYSTGIDYRYSLSIPGNKDIPRLWLAGVARNIEEGAALLQPFQFLRHLEALKRADVSDIKSPVGNGSSFRRASWWDDHGEMHPFDDEGPDFLIQISTTSKNAIGRFATYFYDMDWRLTCHPRQESFVIFNSRGKFLNACWIGKMSGCYYRFVIGQDSIQCRVNKHRGACTSISGLFFDGQASSIENGLIREKGAVDEVEEHFPKLTRQ